MIDRSNLTWDEAKLEADSGGSEYLATITSSAEQNFVYSLVNDAYGLGSTTKFYYLGGFQEPSGGTGEPDQNWQWVTGEAWNYSHWNSTEPSNGVYGNINENALVMYGPLVVSQGYWNDDPSIFPQEWDQQQRDLYGSYITEVPEPCSLVLISLGGLALLRKRRA